MFSRCAAFLGTDLEYEWPPYQWVSLRALFLRLIRRMKKIDQEFELFKSHGDFHVWPFFREDDYLRAISNTPTASPSLGPAEISPTMRV